jgi:LacI family transcriptional regulator
MAKSKVSLGDIAKELKISKTTVSFIINGRAKEKRISEDLEQKVLKKVKELGYKPNHFAQSLRTGKTKIIGLMVEDISNQFFGVIAKKIEEKAYKNGYKIVYCSTENDPERASNFLKMFINLGVEGCIVAPTLGLEQEIQQMIDSGVEVVLFDRKFDSVFTDTVMVDNERGVYHAVELLLKNGCKKIAFVALVLDDIKKEDRITGYLNAMKDFGLSPNLFPFPFTLDRNEYLTGIKEILENNPSIDGVIFGTNYLGISGLEAINSLGLRIPGDLSIISFDDNDLFRIHKPSITAVAQPIEEIATTTINLLIERLQTSGKRKEPVEYVLSTKLVNRDSTSVQSK